MENTNQAIEETMVVNLKDIEKGLSMYKEISDKLGSQIESAKEAVKNMPLDNEAFAEANLRALNEYAAEMRRNVIVVTGNVSSLTIACSSFNARKKSGEKRKSLIDFIKEKQAEAEKNKKPILSIEKPTEKA